MSKSDGYDDTDFETWLAEVSDEALRQRAGYGTATEAERAAMAGELKERARERIPAAKIAALEAECERLRARVAAGTIADLETACREAGITRLGALCDAGTWAVTATTREGDSRDGYADDLAGALLQAVERVTAMRTDRAYADGRDDAELAALAARGVL